MFLSDMCSGSESRDATNATSRKEYYKGEWLRESSAWARCVWLVACGSPPPGSPQNRLSRLSSAPNGGVLVRRWLSMQWDAWWVRPAERSPGVESSVRCVLFSTPKHGGRGRLSRRWMCGLVFIRVRAASEAKNLKAAHALGLLAIAGVPWVLPPRLRGALPSSPPSANAPRLGIAEASCKGTFRSKGS
jgi:hypothetical protein